MTHAKRTYPCIAPALRGRQARRNVARARFMDVLRNAVATVLFTGIVLGLLTVGGLAQ